MIIDQPAREAPEAIAVRMTDAGTSWTYGQLWSFSNRLGHWLRSHLTDPETGSVAILMENRPEFIAVCVACHRAGLRYTPISTHLKPAEISYVLEDSGASILISSNRCGQAAADAADEAGVATRLSVDKGGSGALALEPAIAAESATPVDASREGELMLYSSGTTGRPKGVILKGKPEAANEEDPWTEEVADLFDLSAETNFLLPGPLYHTSPLFFANMVLRLGGSLTVMPKFDAREALEAIEDFGVTHSFFVPTMLIRMLDVRDEVDTDFDLSSHTFSMHGAAPCPVKVKRRLIEWWGPILWEGYAGSERNGMTFIESHEWLEHPGSVGRPVGCEIEIVTPSGDAAEVGQQGLVYFRGGSEFEYHKDPEKTRAAYRTGGWSTIGDIGYLDEEGYLYLTDRQSDVIITGGVNVYPREAEHVLLEHDAVQDVAVVGVPDDDMGEKVKAYVELADDAVAGDELGRELIAFCKERLSSIKCPRDVEFVEMLPRHPNGKLHKRALVAN